MKLRNRRIIVILFALGATALWLFVNPESYDTIFSKVENAGEPEITASSDAPLATELL